MPTYHKTSRSCIGNRNMMHALNAHKLIQLPISASLSLADKIYKLFRVGKPFVKVLKIINAGTCVSNNL